MKYAPIIARCAIDLIDLHFLLYTSRNQDYWASSNEEMLIALFDCFSVFCIFYFSINSNQFLFYFIALFFIFLKELTYICNFCFFFRVSLVSVLFLLIHFSLFHSFNLFFVNDHMHVSFNSSSVELRSVPRSVMAKIKKQTNTSN